MMRRLFISIPSHPTITMWRPVQDILRRTIVIDPFVIKCTPGNPTEAYIVVIVIRVLLNIQISPSLITDFFL